MEKGEENPQKKAHCLIFPYPIQGHINPMLQFAKRLLQKGIEITLVITQTLATNTLFSSSTIPLETISDGSAGLPPGTSYDVYLARFQEFGSKTLKEAVVRLADSGRPVDCIVFDPFLPWCLDVAKEMGLKVAPFFTQSCAVDQIYYHVFKGELKVPLSGEEILVPGLPPLMPEDMPSFMYVHGSYPPLFEMVVNQFSGLENADWLFLNTFHKLEEEVIDYMAKFLPVKTIGPSIPSMYLDKRLPDDKEYGLNVYKPDTEACMEWLNQRQPESVVYVSFGSIAKLGEEQMEELAWGLRLSNKHFLWVVRSSEESKLPKDFANESSKKGLIVSWCPQLDVLAHEAVCCFVTHCGWNSTLEALSLGVPMVGMPQWSDQSTNSKFVTDVWEMGVRAKADDNGVVSRETIAGCIRDVMEGERGEEIKKNAGKWKELGREAVDEGGSSDKNIQEFVSGFCSNRLLQIRK
ncbi:UNVERIFIED_CONTAM: UDP-glycosyltransferase 74E2 [Sesamum latifolium]|uniref:Glycosyltransferase n=1 Tax=Sesamum latifolium TaxID=2727402 RepID=A0AAW2SN51_9LAMI